MSEVSKTQINYLRLKIDEKISETTKIVFLVLHFPSEWKLIKSVYEVTYTNSWNWIYFDSFGYNDLTDENFIDHKSLFNFSGKKFSVQRIYFENKFDFIIEICCDKIISKLKKQYLEYYKKKKNYIIDLFIKIVNQDFLKKKIKSSCEILLKGNNNNSLKKLILNNLENLLLGVCTYFVKETLPFVIKKNNDIPDNYLTILSKNIGNPFVIEKLSKENIKIEKIENKNYNDHFNPLIFKILNDKFEIIIKENEKIESITEKFEKEINSLDLKNFKEIDKEKKIINDIMLYFFNVNNNDFLNYLFFESNILNLEIKQISEITLFFILKFYYQNEINYLNNFFLKFKTNLKKKEFKEKIIGKSTFEISKNIIELSLLYFKDSIIKIYSNYPNLDEKEIKDWISDVKNLW